MARSKISEFKAKKLLFDYLNIPYNGLQIKSESFSKIENLDQSLKYVVKVDEGIKKRNKKGLVKIDLSKDEIISYIKELLQKGYSQFIVEEMVLHKNDDEKYLSLQREREGIKILYSKHGGVDIEENKESIKELFINNPGEIEKIDLNIINIDKEFIENLISFFEKYYFSFIEINPLIIQDSSISILDFAGEVDSVAEFFVDGKWTTEDFTTGEIKHKTDEEKAIEELSHNSQAAFKLDVLNPNGAVFMLLSGGGASIVLADEVAAEGFGESLANYGEYSGNPNQEETYIYTINILNLLIKSNATKKVLIIGGGVANFTDIRITFRGVIKALEEVKDELAKQNIKVFVRRGGPNQKEGLFQIQEFLQKNNLYGLVTGPEMVLTEIINKALFSIK